MKNEDQNQRTSRRPLREWWRAEARGDEAAAEAALFELFAGLPELAPSPGFAARVVALAGLSSSSDPRWLWAGRLLLLAALGAVGASLLFVVPLVGVLLRLVPEISAGGLAGILSWWVGPLELILTFGRLAQSLGEALITVALTPEVGAFVLGTFLLGWMALRSLGRLLDSRSMIHVH